MDNFTRDPFHRRAQSIYAKNVSRLKVYVDGELLNSRQIVNVYRKVNEGQQYVELFTLDDKGHIVEQAGKPVTYKIHGEITVEGSPSHCGCWRGKRIHAWWRRLNDGRPGW